VSTHDQGDLGRRIERVEDLIRQSETLPDPAARACVREVVQTLLDFHGAGLARILDHLASDGGTGRAAVEALSRDELVGSLLLLHGLHPLDVETRVRAALEKMRPRLRTHGGDVELLGVQEGVVRIRTDTDVRTIEAAVYEAAPDAVSVEVVETTQRNGETHTRMGLPILRG
jgi:hypothetical protein